MSFNFRNVHYWRLLRESLSMTVSNVNSIDSATTLNVSSQKYQIPYNDFISFHHGTNKNDLYTFLRKNRKAEAFQSRLNSLGIEFDHDQNGNCAFFFNENALQHLDLPSWCGEVVGMDYDLSLLLFFSVVVN